MSGPHCGPDAQPGMERDLHLSEEGVFFLVSAKLPMCVVSCRSARWLLLGTGWLSPGTVGKTGSHDSPPSEG